jgi:hypothetical protein
MKQMVVTRMLKTFLWTNTQTIDFLVLPCLIIVVYKFIKPCIRLMVQAWPTQHLIGIVGAVLVMGFVDCLLCNVRNNAKPTYTFLYSLSCGSVEVMTVLQKHCLRYTTFCISMLEVFDLYEKIVPLWMKYVRIE